MKVYQKHLFWEIIFCYRPLSCTLTFFSILKCVTLYHISSLLINYSYPVDVLVSILKAMSCFGSYLKKKRFLYTCICKVKFDFYAFIFFVVSISSDSVKHSYYEFQEYSYLIASLKNLQKPK